MNMFRRNRFTLKPHNTLALMAMGLLLWALPAFAADNIRDAKNRQVSVDKPFQRIISLYGAHTENLFHLGLDKEVIGVSVHDAYPTAVQQKQRFSYHDDPEKFLAAGPDLVLIRPMIDNGYPDFVRQLERYKITVVSLQPANVDEMFDYWRTLGKLTHRTAQAEHLVRTFREKTSAVKKLVAGVTPKKRVYFEAIHSRMKTFSKGAMAVYALETAGGINIATDAKPSRNTNIANYGKERILAKADQIDVFLAQKGIMNPVKPDFIFREPGFDIIRAVKEGQVFLIDENIVSRPVPRLYEGIVTIGKLLYPDTFATLEKDL